MGKKSRDKGARYENEIAHLFRLLGFDGAKRHLEFQSEEADEGRDLDGTFPFAVQCKCWAKTPSISCIEQIVPTNEYPLPIAFLKRTQSKGVKSLEVVAMPVDVFEAIVFALRNWGSELYGEHFWGNALLDAYDVGIAGIKDAE
jgi:hypothetical protein